MVQDITSLINQIRIERDIFQKYRLIEYLMKEKKLRVIDISKKIGYKPSFICHLLRLKKIPDVLIDGYYSKSITSSHLYIISRLNNPREMIELYEKILSENYTVRQTEEAVREYLYQVKSIGKYIKKETSEKYAKRIKELFPETDIKVVQTRIKGTVSIEIKGNLETSTKTIKHLLEKLSG